jgi:Fe-S cluster assembly protein SufD
MNQDKHKKIWYLENFKSFEENLNGHSKTFLHDLRKEALQRLSQLLFPTLKDEEWKYTNTTPISEQNFIPISKPSQYVFSKEKLKDFLFQGFEHYLITFINGIFSQDLSDIKGIPKGVTITNISTAAKNNPQVLQKYYNKLSSVDNIFNAINSVYSVDGSVISVSDGIILDKPIQILYLNGDETNSVLSAPRNLIIIGKKSQANIIVNYYGIGSNPYFTNVISEVYVDEGGIVDFMKNQSENENSFHIEKFQALQEKNSVFNHYNFEFGGNIIRNDINSVLNGENIETHYYGLSLANGKQHIDNHTFVDHAKPNCMSNEVYKAILDDEAHGVFNGKIIVRKNAQKTNAYQQNKTILLSKKAKIDTKPQLEIFADDVKCSHGATIGHLDDNAYFYIRTRGIPDNLAKSILIRAFANDVVESVKIEHIRDQLNHMIFEHLHRVEVMNE